MPPRSLRVGTRLPNPGAVLRGCPRPKALRFDTPFSSARLSPFGDGFYTGNIVQSGQVLQPQNYVLPDGSVLRGCIAVTGAATVAPDSTTDAAAFMCHNLVLDGAAATLAASGNCKGLLGFVSGRVVLLNTAHMHMDALGKAGAFGDLSPDMLLPALLASHVALDRLKPYVVKGRGAEGGGPRGADHASSPGYAAGPMQTGGGGTGMNYNGWVGAGGCGGPCCGGAGSGGNSDSRSATAGNFGGPGSAGAGGAGGGAGDPPGHQSVNAGDEPGRGAGGGLLCLVASTLALDASTLISADGAQGGDGAGPGGSAGGGCVVIITRPGGYANSGTAQALGGARTRVYSGPGGAGSVNIFELEE